MRTVTLFLGIILILFSIASFTYQKITYTKQEKVAEIGSLQITADKEKSISFPPIASGLAFAAGIILVIISRKIPR